MRDEELPPDPQLMESLRAVGYSMETAIADIVDNSIAAGARTVRVAFAASPRPHVTVLDDGRGMTRAEARHAMCLAADSSLEVRGTHDLGRFGLGLKTASLSQCRRLTVFSKKSGHLSAFRWDLDHLLATGKWSLLELEPDDVGTEDRLSGLSDLESGTLVVWEHLDQLPGGELGRRALDEQMDSTYKHIGLVFHRYISGEATGVPLEISLNLRPLEECDPFLTNNKATQKGHRETFSIRGETVTVEPYTLPHISKMSAADRNRAQVTGRMRDSQGFYIYRAKRLVIWGTWFKLVPKDDLGKLARVRVDIPNTLDAMWTLDIKKSAMQPPPEIKEQLRRTVTRIVTPSRSAHLYRGRSVSSKSAPVPYWNVIEDRAAFRYEINRDHPALSLLSDSLDSAATKLVEHMLRGIEAGFPVHDAYNRLSQDTAPRELKPGAEELFEYARLLWNAYEPSGRGSPEFVTALAGVEPFSLLDDPTSLLERASSEDG